VNPHAYDPVRTTPNEFLEAGRRLGVNRIKQARTLEKARRKLVIEGVFEVTVVVLIDLGVDDDRVIEFGFLGERCVHFQR
jgi:hypothetical protein